MARADKGMDPGEFLACIVVDVGMHLVKGAWGVEGVGQAGGQQKATARNNNP